MALSSGQNCGKFQILTFCFVFILNLLLLAIRYENVLGLVGMLNQLFLTSVRYSLWSYGDTAELRVDLLSFLQRLQAATGSARGVPHSGRVWEVAMNPQDADGATWSDGGLDLGLVLDCGQAGSKVTCGASGVHLTHTPFVVVYYG